VDYENLLAEKDDGVAVVKFNRPKFFNALNIAIMSELDELMAELDKDSDVKVIVLTGEGKAFAAGADIAEMKEMNGMEARAFALRTQRILARLENLDKPVIAAINGYALGGGCEVALACDLRFAAENAKIGQPELKLGVIPGWAGTQRLTRLVGVGKAKEMIYTSEPVGGKEAERIGLVNRAVPQDELMNVVMDTARKMIAMGPVALRMAKTVINRGIDSSLSTATSYEAEGFGLCFASGETREGMTAFLEKRKPTWQS
jgi:enoyl-CoA hydratase